MTSQYINKNSRTFAIGDIHGHLKQLDKLINAIAPTNSDTLIFLGDYVDRGPDSKGVIEKILALKEICQVIMLKGNHEVMMEQAIKTENIKDRHNYTHFWMKYGGIETLESYETDGNQLLTDKSFSQFELTDKIQKHLHIIENLPLFHITDTHIFVHASPKLTLNIEKQDEEYLLWRKVNKRDAELDFRHQSGKTIICGHTDQENGLPNRFSDKYIVIDSGCYKTGWLTAINVDTEEFIRASEDEVERFY